jgi:hypothetical protein
MTFVLALAELGLLYAIARVLNIHLSALEAIGYYWAAWLLAVGTKIVLLPIVSLTYLESAGEFRRDQWSIPPSLELIPIMPSAPKNGHGAVVESASRPDEPVTPTASNGLLILVHEGSDPPLEYPMRPDVTIGRKRCDITIDDPALERRHAVIEHFSSGLGIRALHADGAVAVNEHLLTDEWVLAPGDRISIGATNLRVESAKSAPAMPVPHAPRGEPQAGQDRRRSGRRIRTLEGRPSPPPQVAGDGRLRDAVRVPDRARGRDRDHVRPVGQQLTRTRRTAGASERRRAAHRSPRRRAGRTPPGWSDALHVSLSTRRAPRTDPGDPVELGHPAGRRLESSPRFAAARPAPSRTPTRAAPPARARARRTTALEGPVAWAACDPLTPVPG